MVAALMAMRYGSVAELPAHLRAQVEAKVPALKVRRPRRKQTDSACLFLQAWVLLADKRLRAPAAEWTFAQPRRWRFDFAWPVERVAVEVDGGRWALGGGKHGSDEDREKLNRAAELGWLVLRYSPAVLRRDPAGVVAEVERALRGRR